MAGRKKKSEKKVEFEENDPGHMQLEAEKQPPQSDSAQVPEPAEQTHSAQATVTSTESVKRRSGGPRSVCAMYKVVVKKAQGKKLKVTYNERGVPNGSSRHTLQSYIGMLARTMVPIDIPRWPAVDNELKNKIWLDVQETFKVSPKSEQLVLKSAGMKWRQFKTALTTKFILPFLGQKKKLARPPKQYSFVGRETWKRFVATRTTDEFMPIHDEQSKRVCKRKYPHRLSRKGYIGLHEEEVKSGKLEVGEEPDRALLWKKARIPKDSSQVDDELTVIHNKIDMLLDQQRRGEFKPSGSNDVLNAVLETPEHSGRVRGVGCFITPTQYFNLPKGRRIRITKAELLARDHQRSEEMDKAKEEMEKSKHDMMLEIAQLKALIINSPMHFPSPMLSSKGSIQLDKEKLVEVKAVKKKTNEGLISDDDDDEDCTAIDPPPPSPRTLKGPRSCELALETLENKVAFGMVFPQNDEEMSDKIHGSPMPSGCVRVSVDGSINPDALLPVPIIGEMETVEEAVGSHVAWPEHLIIIPKPVILKKEMSKRKKPESKKTLFHPNYENVPQRYRLLYKHASTVMELSGTPIQFPCDIEVFGVEKTIYVLPENLIALLEYGMLGQAVIASYMLSLHTMIRNDAELSETFAFFHPGATFKLDAEFDRYFVTRMLEGNADRMFFIPHNKDMHWILSIIWEEDIYIINPLPGRHRYQELEVALSSGLKAFNAQTGRGNKIPKIRYLNGAPKQPGGHECAYVVMRYMKELIEDKDLTLLTKWSASTRKTYNKEQLDEVRFAALDHIENFIVN